MLDLSGERLTSRDVAVIASLLHLDASRRADEADWLPTGVGVQAPPPDAVAKGLPPMAVMEPVPKLAALPLSRLDLSRNQLGGYFNPISVPQATFEPNPWATAMLTESLLTQPHLTTVDLSRSVGVCLSLRLLPSSGA